jgi:hypothetical protein
MRDPNQSIPTHQRPFVGSDVQVSNAVTAHHQHPVGAWLAPADNITSGPMTVHPTSASRTTPPSAQAADVGQGMPSSFIWSFSHAEPTFSSVSIRRSDQPCPTRRTRR